MGNWYAETIQADPRFRSRDAIRDMAMLEPGFRARVLALIEDARAAAGTELAVVETYRSSERQRHLYDLGATQLRRVGVHHYGLAVDFAKRVGGKLTWDGDWAFMPRLCKRHALVSGVDWGEPGKKHSFIDSGHVQGVTLAQQAGLFAGSWYPGGQGVGPLAPVPAVPVVVPSAKPPSPKLNSAQQRVLDIANRVNRDHFGDWFWRSSIMAFCEVESDFDPEAVRHEPSGVTSYGLMQVLDVTAADMGLAGDPEQMFDPEVGLFYGMKYAAQGWNYLVTHFGRPPTLTEWCEGYNVGYPGVTRGRSNPAYSKKWLAAQKRWAGLVDPLR